MLAVEERSLDELRTGHLELYPTLAAELDKLSPRDFFAVQGVHWSPAEHVDHLIRSVLPLGSALTWPRFILRLLFGSADRSRSADIVVGEYLKRLAAGGRARGRYRPRVEIEVPSKAAQRQLLARCRWLGDELGRALFRWREGELDRYRLPHPLLGRLTIREMLAWSLYHGRHHRARILERMAAPLDDGNSVSESAPGLGSGARGSMSQCRAVHFDDDSYVSLPLQAPAVFREYDYGSTIVAVWGEVVDLGLRIGAGDLGRFVCPEGVYLEVDELSERLEEAVQEGDEQSAAELFEERSKRLPSHDPAEVLRVVRGLLEHLRQCSDGRLASMALVDLEGYEIALERAMSEGRRVYLSPF